MADPTFHQTGNVFDRLMGLVGPTSGGETMKEVVQPMKDKGRIVIAWLNLEQHTLWALWVQTQTLLQFVLQSAVLLYTSLLLM